LKKKKKKKKKAFCGISCGGAAGAALVSRLWTPSLNRPLYHVGILAKTCNNLGDIYCNALPPIAARALPAVFAAFTRYMTCVWFTTGNMVRATKNSATTAGGAPTLSHCTNRAQRNAPIWFATTRPCAVVAYYAFGAVLRSVLKGMYGRRRFLY